MAELMKHDGSICRLVAVGTQPAEVHGRTIDWNRKNIGSHKRPRSTMRVERNSDLRKPTCDKFELGIDHITPLMRVLLDVLLHLGFATEKSTRHGAIRRPPLRIGH